MRTKRQTRRSSRGLGISLVGPGSIAIPAVVLIGGGLLALRFLDVLFERER